MKRYFNLLLIVFIPHFAFGVGAWYQTPTQVPLPKNQGFDPHFIILKTGIFSSQGILKSFTISDSLKKICGHKRPISAWITHRLSQGETLTEVAGKKLGISISQTFAGSCIESIELDIEPLSKMEPWFTQFLKAVKHSMDVNLKLHIAIPATSPRKLKGFYWTLEDTTKALDVIDGLDIMMYDTGSKNQQEYSLLFRDALFFAMELVKDHDGKSIRLGIPAYPDKTKWHNDQIENLGSILTALKDFRIPQLGNFCLKRVQLAVYAGWTLTSKDTSWLKELTFLEDSVCKKDK